MAEAASSYDRISAIFLKALHLEVPSRETDLLESGALDSLALVNLLAHLEQEFGIKIGTDDLELDNFRSIEKIAEFIAGR